jgi:protein-S-isoprenylcysteine O-methyltransferase Ste14
MTIFDYFQIAAVVLVVTLFFGRTFYLLAVKQINPIVLGVGKRGVQRIAELAVLVGFALWLNEVRRYALHLYQPDSMLNRVLVDSLVAKVVGVVLIAIGFILFIWALISFGNSWRVGIDMTRPGELVTGGVFAFSRNPIFVFLDLYFIGTFLINGTLIFLIAALIAVIGAHYQIIQEERFLTYAYGREYQDYRRTTDRYFSWHHLLGAK